MKSIVILSLLLLQGCVSTDKVMFITKTSLSVADVDTAPSSISLGYDRIEGYFGPRYPNGSVPPVIASINSDGDLINPEISQLYATGEAAIAAASGDNYKGNGSLELISASDDEKELMFFGTSTNIGFKIGTLNNVPNSFNFGYKRKEASIIPIAKKVVKASNGKEYKVDVYPSVLASIENKNSSGSGNGTLSKSSAMLKNQQFFATGRVAVVMAQELSGTFVKKAKQTVGQKARAADILKCYAGIKDEHKISIWKDADRLKLFHEKDTSKKATLNSLIGLRDAAVADLAVDRNLKYQEKMNKADSIYAGLIAITGDMDAKRGDALTTHKNTTCSIARIL